MIQFFTAGGVFMIPLFIVSVISMAFIIERALALRYRKVMPKVVQELVEECGPEQLDQLRVACVRHPSPFSRLTLLAIEHLSWPKAENASMLESRARHEILLMERGLVVLQICVGIAPLLGLMGTIHGLMILFADVGRASTTETLLLARGISIALNTTMFGLIIAIPSLIAWSYYTKKIENLAAQMEALLDDFLRRMYRLEATKEHRKTRQPQKTS